MPLRAFPLASSFCAISVANAISKLDFVLFPLDDVLSQLNHPLTLRVSLLLIYFKTHNM